MGRWLNLFKCEVLTTANDSGLNSVVISPSGLEDEPLPDSAGSDFFQLRQLIKSKGLLDKQPGYYTFKIVSTLALLAAAIAFLVIVDNFWLRLLDAVFLAMVFGQIGFVGHDAGHQAITRSQSQPAAL